MRCGEGRTEGLYSGPANVPPRNSSSKRTLPAVVSRRLTLRTLRVARPGGDDVFLVNGAGAGSSTRGFRSLRAWRS
jgi:hypothetical protein